MSSGVKYNSWRSQSLAQVGFGAALPPQMILSGSCGAALPHHNYQKKEPARVTDPRAPDLATAMKYNIAAVQRALKILRSRYDQRHYSPLTTNRPSTISPIVTTSSLAT